MAIIGLRAENISNPTTYHPLPPTSVIDSSRVVDLDELIIVAQLYDWYRFRINETYYS